MNDADVVIVGAGLSGLRAALEVSCAGLSVLVVERKGEVGGRIRTSIQEGCILDHGFQAIFPDSPELKSLALLEPLKLGLFDSGARIRIDGKQYDLTSPWRHTSTLLKTLKTPVARIRDIVRLTTFILRSPGSAPRKTGRSVARALDQIKFSQLFKGSFLAPLLRAMLLDPSLASDEGLARFYLRSFLLGSAALPSKGIQALPKLMAERLGLEHILLDQTVTHLRPDRVVLQSGDEIRARYVICAADALSAAALGSPEQATAHLANATLYFLAERAPYSEPILTLNGDSRGPINNLAVLSNVQPSYAPTGRALISLSVLGEVVRRSPDQLLQDVRLQLREWFGSEAADWRHLRTFVIPHALPARPHLGSGAVMRDGIIYAGDYLSYGSQNGALAAGRAAAQCIIV